MTRPMVRMNRASRISRREKARNRLRAEGECEEAVPRAELPGNGPEGGKAAVAEEATTHHRLQRAGASAERMVWACALLKNIRLRTGNYTDSETVSMLEKKPPPGLPGAALGWLREGPAVRSRRFRDISPRVGRTNYCGRSLIATTRGSVNLESLRS
jgi:hypothetical protein